MRVSVDKGKCVGHAQCYAVAQAVYDLDEHGFCEIPLADVPAEYEEEARAGADSCPEVAITLVE